MDGGEARRGTNENTGGKFRHLGQREGRGRRIHTDTQKKKEINEWQGKKHVRNEHMATDRILFFFFFLIERLVLREKAK